MIKNCSISNHSLVGFPGGSDDKESALLEIQVWSLGWEEPLEKRIATHSSILAWGIPWTEEPGGLQFTGSQRVRHDWVTNTVTFYFKLRYNIVLISGVQLND